MAKIKGLIPPKKPEKEPMTPRNEADHMNTVIGLIVGDLKELKTKILDESSAKIAEINYSLDNATTTLDKKIEEVNQTTEEGLQKVNDIAEKAVNIIEQVKQDALDIIREIKVGPAGKDGIDGKPADEKMIVKTVIDKIPKLDEEKLLRRFIAKIPENKASLKIIQEKFETDPMSVIDKILALPEGKFKLKVANIDGLEQTIRAFHHQIGTKGYLHGGGDTIVAGSGITITNNANGTKTISVGSSMGDVVGPASATDNAIARFDGATGKLIQNSTVIIADTTGNMSGMQKVTIGVAGAATGSLELVGTTSGIVTLKVANIAGTYTLTLPTDDGTPNQVLTTDGSGVLTWTTPAGSGATTALDNLAAVAINASLLPGTSDAIALGSTTKQWSDLFLAEGGVINWDNGDATLTQVGNVLTLAGADFVADNITVNTALLPDANDGAALGNATTSFSDLFLAEGGVINWDNGDATITQTGNDITIAGITTFGVGITTAVTLGTIELGHASDTTIARVSAGVVSIEGVNIVTTSSSDTLTNKRITGRVVTVADATSISPNADTTDFLIQLNTQGVGTLTVNNPSGTPTDGQVLFMRIKSTNVQTFSWGGQFQSTNDITLPTASTGSSKYDEMGFRWNATSSKWTLSSLNFGAV